MPSRTQTASTSGPTANRISTWHSTTEQSHADEETPAFHSLMLGGVLGLLLSCSSISPAEAAEPKAAAPPPAPKAAPTPESKPTPPPPAPKAAPKAAAKAAPKAAPKPKPEAPPPPMYLPSKPKAKVDPYDPKKEAKRLATIPKEVGPKLKRGVPSTFQVTKEGGYYAFLRGIGFTK